MRSDVPEGWDLRQLKKVGATFSGLAGKTKADFGEGKPFITYKQVFDDSVIDLSRCAFVSIDEGERQDKVEAGDILFTTSSETPDEVAYSSVLLDEPPELYLNSFCFGYRPYSQDELLSEFAQYLFRGPTFRRLATLLAQGSTRYNISKTKLMEHSLLLPPLPEQRKIAAILGSVDEAIQATASVIAQTRRVKEGLLQDLLTRGIGHTRFKQTEIGEIPETWEVKRLGEVLDGIVPGRSPSAKDKPANGQEWGVLKVSAVGHGVFHPDQNKVLPPDYEIKSSHIVKGGDVLITRANTAALVAATCRVPRGDYQLMLCDKTLRLVPEPTLIESDFLLATLSQPRARSHFALAATGSSASMKNVSQACIRSFRIAVPNISEQRRITATLQSVRDTLAAEVCRQDQLQQLKAGLLQDLLTGKVRVENSEL